MASISPALVVALACPLLRQVGARVVDGLGHVGEVLLGVEAVNDLNSVGKCSSARFQIPGPIAEHDLARRAFDRCRVADRAHVAHGRAFFCPALSALQIVTSLTRRVLAEPSGC